MTRRTPSPFVFALLACLLSFAPRSYAASKQPDHWVGTWAAAPLAVANREGKFGAADTTYREIVHVTLGGQMLRVELSNELGTDPLTIGAVHAALSAGQGAIQLTSANALTFSGQPSITIPAGGSVISDAFRLPLAPFSDLAISIFVPAQTISTASVHTFADQTSYTAPGNVVGARSLPSPTEIYTWPFLKAVDVLASADSASVVTFGDSITDGAHSTRDTNNRWPDLLAHRLQGSGKTSHLSVLNEGIGGNRVLHDNSGPNALSRFDRDVLSHPNVKYLIILEGINDIGHAKDPVRPYDVVSAEDIIAGLSQLATRAHLHGIKVFGATLTPYVGAKYASPAGETMRQAVNEWIRTTKDLDGVIDFEKATRDPSSSSPIVYAPSDDSGDHLHPGDAGYKAMADSIDLGLFKDKK